MMKSRPSRWLKGTLVSAVAAVVCYWFWGFLDEWAGETDSEGSFSGLFTSLFAGIMDVASMPVLLWAGMRVLRERGNHLLVMLDAIAWFFVGGMWSRTTSALLAPSCSSPCSRLSGLCCPVSKRQEGEGKGALFAALAAPSRSHTGGVVVSLS
ncbi:hypothetical protein ACH4U7_52645 [Streptomyces sp. NPDC020845]|uniref:hypothetical protein n=1 Tax=Streptomyces sp. NPDC020845 TaxID=3365096 RepID=UPI0037AA69CE